MPKQATVSNTLSIGGTQYGAARTQNGTSEVEVNDTLAAAKTGSLTTRTSNTAGTLTMDAGHGIATGNRLDLYWTNADGTKGARYGITVGTVSTNSVPISSGAGDNLPTLNSAITAMVPTKYAMSLPYAKLLALGVGAAAPAVAAFVDGSDAAVFGGRCTGTGGHYLWDAGNGASNPFGTTNVASVFLSHGDSTAAQNVSTGATLST